jgi:WD40-like Beta Propeller Repeat
MVMLGLGALAAPGVAAAHPGAWAPAVNAEEVPGTSPDLNTPYLDGCPIQSGDGRRLYLASNRPDGIGGIDIWLSRRPHRHAPWGAPENLGRPVNSEVDDFCPTPVGKRHLLFVSTRPGGCGDADMYVARQRRGGWSAPRNLGCGVNSAAGEASPSLLFTQRGLELYFSSNRPGGYAAEAPGAPPDADLYSTRLRRFGFETPAPVPGLNTTDSDARPNVRRDGLEIVFDSTRPGTLGGSDIYSARRSSVFAGWSAPENLGSLVNSPANESRASLSRKGETLLFGSNRPGSEPAPGTPTVPSSDIYVSTR